MVRNEEIKYSSSSHLTHLQCRYGQVFLLSHFFFFVDKINVCFEQKGIYFTSYLRYSLKYALLQAEEPTVIISAILLGNSFPVIESKNNFLSLHKTIYCSLSLGYQSNESLFGKPIQPSYQVISFPHLPHTFSLFYFYFE